ncbi:PREDICTED: ribonuclease P/MRP protein subunit POP5 [Rhagoletis zephyria]|uniref:ribonuclease P/MRP protein subunit POP5 n=1 Tax=Rhagoletis zephyria TaxID=28612 RepID=UPI000811A390|nr:PREDICTED: ribonuclease P/MRP protein subunit POP5 [Rhagoletis zephyria]XP_036336411.1 ribonuclease P/MRP protein subunit POP5 [Rhagoletis pomonella]
MVRIKNRYIVVRIVPEVPAKVLNFHDAVIAKCILNHVKKFYGDYGLGTVEQGFRVKYCNERTKVTIIRCLHRSHRVVTSTLPLITMIGDVRAKFHTLYTGATIIQCNKFIINHQQRFLDEMVGQIASAKERKEFIKRVMEFDLEQ